MECQKKIVIEMEKKRIDLSERFYRWEQVQEQTLLSVKPLISISQKQQDNMLLVLLLVML